MPFLIRIILQRILIVVYSFLAFIGLAPEASIPTEEEAKAAIEERRDSILDFFQDKETKDRVQEVVDSTKEIREKIKEIDIEVEIPEPVEIPIKENENDLQDLIEKTINEVRVVENSLITKGTIDDKIVNIVCSRRDGNLVAISTGSGVIVDPDGIILTNAHVGQFVLVEDNHKRSLMKCAVYKENNPTFGFLVDVLYISPEWIQQNYKLVNSENPRGTGESDYAFLYITESTNPAISRPKTFPYAEIKLDEDLYEEGTTVSVGGYPGSPENIIDIVSAGNLKKDIVSILDVFTFNRNSIDVIRTTKTNVGARGASGGGVFDSNNNLIAMIVTTTGDQYNANINAITTTYINDSLRQKTGKTINSLLRNPAEEVDDFANNYGEVLAELLINEIY